MIGRLERAYALLAMQCADSLQEEYPQLDAEGRWIAGGVALFAGVGSPLSQAYGMGFDGEVDHHDFEELEDFYGERGAQVIVDACLGADPSLLSILEERDYQLIGKTDTLVRDLDDLEELDEVEIPGLEIVVDPGPLWAQVVAEGFYPGAELPEYLQAIFHTYLDIPSSTCFLALLDGEPAGGGALGVFDEIGMLYSTSVLPDYRGRGIQKALLQARLGYALREGCDVAMVFTDPGSTSQRNVMKQGFEITHTKVKMIEG